MTPGSHYNQCTHWHSPSHSAIWGLCNPKSFPASTLMLHALLGEGGRRSSHLSTHTEVQYVPPHKLHSPPVGFNMPARYRKTKDLCWPGGKHLIHICSLPHTNNSRGSDFNAALCGSCNVKSEPYSTHTFLPVLHNLLPSLKLLSDPLSTLKHGVC